MGQEGEEPVEAVPLKVMVTALAGDGERLLQVGIDVGLPADELIVNAGLTVAATWTALELYALRRTIACVEAMLAGIAQEADLLGGYAFRKS
jgi:hypothetical protein